VLLEYSLHIRDRISTKAIGPSTSNLHSSKSVQPSLPKIFLDILELNYQGLVPEIFSGPEIHMKIHDFGTS